MARHIKQQAGMADAPHETWHLRLGPDDLERYLVLQIKLGKKVNEWRHRYQAGDPTRNGALAVIDGLLGGTSPAEPCDWVRLPDYSVLLKLVKGEKNARTRRRNDRLLNLARQPGACKSIDGPGVPRGYKQLEDLGVVAVTEYKSSLHQLTPSYTLRLTHHGEKYAFILGAARDLQK